MRRALIVLGALGCGGAGFAPAPVPALRPVARPPAPPEGLRLPAGVRPVREAIALHLDPEREPYDGHARIELALDAAAPVVWLNAADLEIRGASVGGRPATVVSGGADVVGFAFDPPLGAGAQTLDIEFAGRLDGERRALFRSRQADGAYAIYSFFEPLGARRAFPCFDDPGWKIPWRLELTVPHGALALGNAPLAARTPGPRADVVTFAETRPLPSYLVALVVGPLDVVEAGTAGRGDVRLRFVVPRGRAAQTRYAAAVTARVLERLEDLTGIPYPFEKLDVVAVPEGAESVEHPGLIAIDETLMLAPPGRESTAFQRLYVRVAAHELAHIWFGDLVTCAYWNDLWLNEGLAQWADLEVTDGFEPAWRFRLEAAARRADAMAADHPGSPALRALPATADDVERAFDPALTYDKGATVLGMFAGWMGAERFRAALHAYLEARAWKSATADDLLAALGADVAPALRTFLDQPALPTVEARPVCARGRPPIIEVTQADPRWRVPVCVAWGAGGQRRTGCVLLEGAYAKLPVDRCPEWVMANEGGRGYYRVAARPADVARLLGHRLTSDAGEALSGRARSGAGASAPARRVALSSASGRLTDHERLTLALDLRGLVGTAVTRADALALVPALAADPEPRVVEVAIGLARTIRPADLVPELAAGYARLMRRAFSARAHALGWRARPGESDDLRLLRADLLRLVALRGEEPLLVEEARGLAMRWLEDPRAVDPELVDAVLAIAGRSRSEKLWLGLRAAVATADRDQRLHLLGALAGFDDPELTRSALDLALGDALEVNERLAIFRRALANPRTRELAYGFIKEHLDAVEGRLGPKGTGLLVWDLGQAFCDDGHRADLEAALRPSAAEPRAVSSAIDAMRHCLQAAEADAPGLIQLLRRP